MTSDEFRAGCKTVRNLIRQMGGTNMDITSLSRSGSSVQIWHAANISLPRIVKAITSLTRKPPTFWNNDTDAEFDLGAAILTATDQVDTIYFTMAEK